MHQDGTGLCMMLIFTDCCLLILYYCHQHPEHPEWIILGLYSLNLTAVNQMRYALYNIWIKAHFPTG